MKKTIENFYLFTMEHLFMKQHLIATKYLNENEEFLLLFHKTFVSQIC